MGSLCSCFHVPDAEDNVEESNSSNNGNCRCPYCFVQNITNKYRALFGRLEVHSIPSFHGAASSGSMMVLNNTQSDSGRHLPNTMNSQNSQLQNDFVDMGRRKSTCHSQLESEALRRSDLRISPKQDGSCHNEELKQCKSESSRKALLERLKTGVGYDHSSFEDEDVCPTCLEEYTPENPKIITRCRHHYHLSCIYEWMERSEKCPICAKLMEFFETS